MRSLDQTRVWTTRAGITMTLEEMDPGHRCNLMAMMERQAGQFKWRYEWSFGLEVAMHDGGEMAHDALEGELSRIENTPAVEWMRETPLYRRLVELDEETKAYVAHQSSDNGRRIFVVKKKRAA